MAFNNHRLGLKYIYKGDTMINVDDRPIEEFERFMRNDKNRILRHTHMSGEVLVSTVFMGINMSPFGSEFFETMIFGGKFNQLQMRHSKRSEALMGHRLAVHLVKGLIRLPRKQKKKFIKTFGREIYAPLYSKKIETIN